MIPGEWLLLDEAIEINPNRRTGHVAVRNTGDRAVQIGSHFHFFEVNRVLDFDRAAAFGMRLDVPSGQSIRFEAGDERDVALVEFGGVRRIIGFNNLVNGASSAPSTEQRAVRNAALLGFLGAGVGGDPLGVDVRQGSVAEAEKEPKDKVAHPSKSAERERL